MLMDNFFYVTSSLIHYCADACVSFMAVFKPICSGHIAFLLIFQDVNAWILLRWLVSFPLSCIVWVIVVVLVEVTEHDWNCDVYHRGCLTGNNPMEPQHISCFAFLILKLPWSPTCYLPYWVFVLTVWIDFILACKPHPLSLPYIVWLSLLTQAANLPQKQMVLQVHSLCVCTVGPSYWVSYTQTGGQISKVQCCSWYAKNNNWKNMFQMLVVSLRSLGSLASL